MEVLDQFYETVINKWRNNKGKGTVHCNKPFSYATLAVLTIGKFAAKRPDASIFIVVQSFDMRRELISEFNKLNVDHSRITCVSQNYIKTGHNYNYGLVVLIDVTPLSIIQMFCERSKFVMNILTSSKVLAPQTLSKVYIILPSINGEISVQQARNAMLCSPVEEHRVAVTISADDRAEYDKQSAYISNTMVIIGDIRNIDRIKHGDRQLGLSGAEVRDKIARSNGWSETLDMSIPFNKQIDSAYNPTLLYEKACTVYEVMRKRRDLVTDNEAKLSYILNIIKENTNKKFVIISKRGEFAALVTKYLNANGIKCGDYHDCIKKAVAVDDDGVPILIKSGTRKGEPKIIGSQAISTANLRRYISGDIQVLSTKNSSLNGLELACDAWIITSSLCEDIRTIKGRFADLHFTTNPNIIYNLYCSGTIEATAIDKVKGSAIHAIIEDTEKNLYVDENTGDIIL